MLLADYDLEPFDAYESLRKNILFRVASTFVWCSMFVGALCIADRDGSWSPSWEKQWYDGWLLCLSGCMLSLSIYHLQPLRKFLETPVLQYLGKVSFGIYLCHMPIIEQLSDTYIRPGAVYICGSWLRLAFWLAMFVEVPIVLSAAHMFERYIDRSSIKAAKWLEEQFIDAETVNTPSLPQ